MSWMTALAGMLIPVQARSDYPSWDEQMATVWRRASTPAFRTPGVEEALGVPAIFGAVSLISNTVGSLSLEGYRQGSLLDEPPRLIVRPNPRSTPRDFFRDTAFYMATRGEAWWWIAARDSDGMALSLFPIPPWEITVDPNDANRLRPTIKWGDRTIPNDDLRQITYLPGRDGRGKGPLQLAGAAVSVSVEAEAWAANFFSGSIPSMIGTTDMPMDEQELEALDRQWTEKPPNLPRWLTNGVKMGESPFDPQRAQLTESRQHQVGDVARMFNMPGRLLEHQIGGASLQYQNQADIWADYQRRCLSPHYLEPIEQTISDLLTRSTVARFNTDQLLRADPKTRAEVYEKLVPIGVVSPEEARKREGYAPGNVDYAPVPLSQPGAFPALLPENRTALAELRCPKCNKFVGRAGGPVEIACSRCGHLVAA
jgi:HK97 family phage portal protein